MPAYNPSLAAQMTIKMTVHSTSRMKDHFEEFELELPAVPRIGETIFQYWSAGDGHETRKSIVTGVWWIAEEGKPSRVKIEVEFD